MAPVLTELNDVAFRIERVTHDDSVEEPLFGLRFHAAPVSLRGRSNVCETLDEEDRLERGRSAAGRRFRELDPSGCVLREAMHDQLEPWRLQQNVIVVAIRFVETEDAAIESGNSIKVTREQYSS